MVSPSSSVHQIVMWSLSNQLSSAQLPLGMAPPVVVSRSRKEKHQTLGSWSEEIDGGGKVTDLRHL
jgi:hypothetical protein